MHFKTFYGARSHGKITLGAPRRSLYHSVEALKGLLRLGCSLAFKCNATPLGEAPSLPTNIRKERSFSDEYSSLL